MAEITGQEVAAVNDANVQQVVDAAPAGLSNQANAVLGLYGISGAGKTSLAITAVEEAWEVHRAISLYYGADLGGWGNKALSLIKLKILRVWYLRNHLDPFATMEDASKGYWPEHISNPETGYAANDVKLIAPHTLKWTIICPNGHPIGSWNDPAQVQAVQQVCPTCQVLTNVANAARIDRTRVRNKGFARVGLRIYDSMTQLNEYGMQVLKDESAIGKLGDVLGSADAMTSGGGQSGTSYYKFATGSRAQYGFLQDRTPVWLANIRAIPDQVLPPIVTFGVEMSKGDDESGGNPVYGPKISGNARTSSVPGWLGNCLYVAKELNEETNTLRHRLWFVNHIDIRDPRAVPYMAKHRGEPFGMPREGYLEDDGTPEHAWERCSLRVFFKLLRDQAIAIEARDRAKYADAPALVDDDSSDDQEQVIETISQATPSLGSGAAGVGDTTISRPVSGRMLRRGGGRGRGTAPVVEAVVTPPATTPPAAGATGTVVEAAAQAAAGVPAPVHQAPATVPAAAGATDAAPGKTRVLRRPAGRAPLAIVPPSAPPPQTLTEQLQASLADRVSQKDADAAATIAEATFAVVPPATPAPEPVAAMPPQQAMPGQTTAPAAAPPRAGGARILRRPKPPVGD